jgi:hypothetical protein
MVSPAMASQEPLDHDRLQAVNQCIRDAARQAAGPGGLSAILIERFLRTGKETWEGAGSGQFTLAQFKEDEAYSRAAKTALRNLLDLLANLLPAEAQSSPPVPPETIRQRIEPMVSGLVQADWRDVALREITARTFILNLPGTRRALEAELSTCLMGSAWQVLWALFGDHCLKPDDIKVGCDGLAGDYAHVRWSAYQTDDPYSDVVVHEAAHMLHYLKPSHYGFHVRRGQERFVDIEFHHRELFAYACEAYSRVILQGERKLRIAFAEKLLDAAFSFPRGQIEAIAALVLSAARARNGWRLIREATVIRRTRRRSKPVSSEELVSEPIQTDFKTNNSRPPSYST